MLFVVVGTGVADGLACFSLEFGVRTEDRGT